MPRRIYTTTSPAPPGAVVVYIFRFLNLSMMSAGMIIIINAYGEKESE